MITDDQLAQIQAKLSALQADKAAADTATTSANAAAAALIVAQQASSDAAAAETAADVKATADLADLVSFVDSLASAKTPA